MLFRSEAEIDAWCRRTGQPKGEALSLGVAWELAGAWFGDRLSPDYRGRTQEQIRAIFDAFGLTSDHWRLGSGAVQQDI